MGASLSRATSGGSSRTMSVFSVITPWYDVSIHGLCLFTEETKEQRMKCYKNTFATRRNGNVKSSHAEKYWVSFQLKWMLGKQLWHLHIFVLLSLAVSSSSLGFYSTVSHYKSPPLPTTLLLFSLLFFPAFKHPLQVSKRCATLDQWQVLRRDQTTVSKAKSKHGLWAEGLIKGYNEVTAL